jgi:hypothetical protein
VLELRDATPADAHAIATVHVRSWQAAYRSLLPDAVLAGLSVPAREQSWFDILSAARPRTRTVFAVRGTTMLGFASIGPTLDSAESDPAVGDATPRQGPASLRIPHAVGSRTARPSRRRG